MRGPYPIMCRGHSGGRLVCEAFIRNGIDMGHVSPEKKDTVSFAIANRYIRQIVLDSPDYPSAGSGERARSRRLIKQCVDGYWNAEIGHGGPFGWKMGISLYSMLPVLDEFPGAKVIHLIRDGRDVMMSRLNARLLHLDDPVNRVAVFGKPDPATLDGQTITPDVLEAHRNELEMRHWVTAVTYGLKGRKYRGRYLEIRYEELCRRPVETFAGIFEYLGVPYKKDTRRWLAENVHDARIGKWKNLSEQELAVPLEIGRPLLSQLGYLEASNPPIEVERD